MAGPVFSFRDPAGGCGVVADRVLRFVTAASVEEFQAFLQSPSGRELQQQKLLIATRPLAESEQAQFSAQTEWAEFFGRQPGARFYEHERVPFPSYPHEWPAEMLWEAARLTLEVAQRTLADGWGLKDATPQNVLFRGSAPVFIDLLSFERRPPTDPVWRPYAQFVRTFLLPLLAHRLWGMRLADVFLTRRDGLEPEEVYRWCHPLARLRPSVLSLVCLPKWLSGSARREAATLYQARETNAEKARFIVESLLGRLGKMLAKLEPRRTRASVWSDYMQTHSYSGPAFAAKERFVRDALAELKPARVLDVGANTGHFSVMAAEGGARVVAIDIDPACVGAIYQRARAGSLDLLPLVVDLARPTPALGWQYRESASFLDRARGASDCVLMLAVLHHLLVTERVPLEDVLALAAELTTDALVIEFVAPADEMFRQLTRGREHLHASLTAEVFEAACSKRFDVVRSAALPETHRRLYLLRKRRRSA